MEAAKCDICAQNDFDVMRVEKFTLHTSSEWYPVVTCLCRSCGHVFSNPRLSASELKGFYETEFRESFDIPRGEKTGLFEAESEFLFDVLGRGNGRTALEIGSYTGFMLARLSTDGWVPEGLEPNKASAKASVERFDFPVHVRMLEDFFAETMERRYDLVFMGSILEHVNSPTLSLTQVNKLVKNDGYIYVRVPNVEKLHLDTIADIFPLEHPHMFSPPTLALLLEKTGFQVIRIEASASQPRHIFCIAKRVSRPAGTLQNIDHGRYALMRELIMDYNAYNARLRKQISGRVSYLFYPTPKRVVIYGGGNHTEFLLRYTGLAKANILRIIDSNERKWGANYLGYPIQAPDTLLDEDFDVVVISSRAFQDEIYTYVASVVSSRIEIVKLYDIAASEYPAG